MGRDSNDHRKQIREGPQMEMQEVLERRIEEREQYSRERRFIDRLDKATPLPPAVIDPPKSGWQRTITCRRCGCTVTEPWWNYCPNCGQSIEHYTWAGGKGWNHEEAEKAFRAMMGAAQ